MKLETKNNIQLNFFNTINLEGSELKGARESCNRQEERINVLVPQNNRESEKILFDNEKVFVGQCKTLYDALKRGERLTTGGALIKYKIGDLRRRVKDLRDAGIQVSDKLIEGRFKEYFIEYE